MIVYYQIAILDEILETTVSPCQSNISVGRIVLEADELIFQLPYGPGIV